MSYVPPLADMAFLLNHVVGLPDLPQGNDLDPATVEAVLEEASKLSRDVLVPLNRIGDTVGCTLKDGKVTTPPGFKDAYKQYREGGWNAVPFNPDFGGQGLPWVVAFALQEMWQASNMSFGLCPLLNQAAIEAIEHHGTPEQKDEYLARLISGEWTGTMNLTEPQAGSDLAAVRTRADRQGDGTYRIKGQKIFITYGEHDFADNIIHLVLARLPDAPEGVKGISLFIVPKILRDGTHNDLSCTGIEHKLGIHASPTCTMQYGDKGGAVGYLVGQENEGLKYMFTMMNNARLCVGLQGVAIAEASYQHALAYARDRVQGKALSGIGDRVAIAEHPDVKTMLMTMKAQIEAGRGLAYLAGIALDKAQKGDAAAQARVDLMTPVVKGGCTDMAIEVTSLGVQVHGGMGFIEETGAAQYYRDARILPIYEGTNGIQAADLAFRKVLRDGGAAARDWFADARQDIGGNHPAIATALDRLEDATRWVLTTGASGALDDIASVQSAYLRAFSVVAGALVLAKSADTAKQLDHDSTHDRARTLAFYNAFILPRAGAAVHTVLNGAV